MEIIAQNRELRVEFNGSNNYFVTEAYDGVAVFMTSSKVKAMNFYIKASIARGVN